ncbi:hypothetical protein TCAL_11693 [Tigriopus californicus]|uniref:Tudor domain-containing protein n=1 Tax=Tigriopus californicus TaxID=6832 RepID=A0A553PKS7_TIGCA|nr:hypothetical protein TCAL_11693 [Tigriopus californicus]
MRISSGYLDRPDQKKKLFSSLSQECQIACPGSQISKTLQRKLEEIGRDDRRAIVDDTVDGCTPLFLACKNGSAEVVSFLLSTCEADIEKRGLYEVLEEGVSHHVTPLWCAAVSGRLAVVKVLLRYGADVNAMSDSGSTPIRSACYIVRNGLNTSHFEIIKCLVRHGADIQQPNHFGGTCLINSVQSPDLVRFLVENNVQVNAEDVQHKTALHYAVQENRFESARILLENGADPFKKSKYEDDILQTACLKGSLMIFNYLLETVVYEPSRIAEAFELAGSTFLLDMHDVGSTLFFWRKALEIRHEGLYSQYPKESIKYHRVLECTEIDSKDELEVISGNLPLLKQQALLITERVLGACHKDTIFRYMYAGASHADSNEYKPCVSLWNYALQLKIKKETLLSCDTSFTARAIVQLYINIMMRDSFSSIDFSDVYITADHVNSGIIGAVGLLSVRPVYKAQVDNFDIVLTTWAHLILILLKAARSHQQMQAIFYMVDPVLKLNPLTSQGDTLLHLAVSSSSTLKSNSFLDDDSFSLFPSIDVAEFIIRCGFQIHARNFNEETPLHVAAKVENFNEDVANLLMKSGAHMDLPDEKDVRPLDILQTHSGKLDLIPHVSLKCLATQVLLQQKVPVPPSTYLPTSMMAPPRKSRSSSRGRTSAKSPKSPNMPKKKSPGRTSSKSSTSVVTSATSTTPFVKENKMDFQEGGKVMARWPGTNLFFRANVTYVREDDNEYDVLYEDGTVYTVKAKDVKSNLAVPKKDSRRSRSRSRGRSPARKNPGRPTRKSTGSPNKTVSPARTRRSSRSAVKAPKPEPAPMRSSARLANAKIELSSDEDDGPKAIPNPSHSKGKKNMGFLFNMDFSWVQSLFFMVLSPLVLIALHLNCQGKSCKLVQPAFPKKLTDYWNLEAFLAVVAFSIIARLLAFIPLGRTVRSASGHNLRLNGFLSMLTILAVVPGLVYRKVDLKFVSVNYFKLMISALIFSVVASIVAFISARWAKRSNINPKGNTGNFIVDLVNGREFNPCLINSYFSFPFIPTLITRYIIANNIQLLVWQLVAIGFMNALGYVIFRASETQRCEFAKDPNSPTVKHLAYVAANSGRRILCSGWNGLVRYPNYLGELLMQWSWVLPAAKLAGSADLLIYYLPVFTTLMLIFRVAEANTRNRRRYGPGWDTYCQKVSANVIPKVY